MLEQLFIAFYLITPSNLCSLSKDDCTRHIYIPNGEAFFAKCQLHNTENENITWFRNDSQTEMSLDLQARIHQDGKYLKFFPARLEDSGFYSCVSGEKRSCFCIEVHVFQNDYALCYNTDTLYRIERIAATSLQLECPDVNEFIDTNIATFHWFKECKTLHLTTDKYQRIKEFLIIKDGNPKDSGNYTCLTFIIHNGRTYNISRSVSFTIEDDITMPRPVILNPTDNFIEVELGSPVSVPCQVLFDERITLSWRHNGSVIRLYDKGRVIEGVTEVSFTNGKRIKINNLTFLSVKKEDYGKQFYCCAYELSEKLSEAYFILKQPDPNFLGFLTALFATAAFIIFATVITINIFKVDLVLWYRSSCFYHPHQNDGKIYDAYIMYPRNAVEQCAYDMELFVLKLLPKVLEKKCAYRLFIIGRDDLPGQEVADLVDEAISQSRRLIIVLGQVFNETNLGEDFEQKIAMYDALIRNALKVILIEMEKITDYTFMPESIKYIKQKEGVVQWKGTFTEASLSPNTRFWKNVRYRMPPAPQHSEEDFKYMSIESE